MNEFFLSRRQSTTGLHRILPTQILTMVRVCSCRVRSVECEAVEDVGVECETVE